MNQVWMSQVWMSQVWMSQVWRRVKRSLCRTGRLHQGIPKMLGERDTPSTWLPW